MEIGIVAIGRNEGERLVKCIESGSREGIRFIYVDSGSTDGSVSRAEEHGVEIVELNMDEPFTAARARNAGWRALLRAHPDVRYVQFVDGDCSISDGWIESARDFLEGNPGYGAASGRCKEAYPERSIYNALCDIEWDTSVGDLKAFGGNVMIRTEALTDCGGFDESFIAGEEPEMSFRMRSKGWKIRRLPLEMVRHDAAMTRFGQWWKRSKRSGFSFALGYDKHGKSEERYQRRPVLRSIFWAGALPLSVIGLSFVNPLFLLLALAYPLQFLRLLGKSGQKGRMRIAWSFFTLLGKFPELSGILSFFWKKAIRQKARIIEYK
jgi:GT2 family glycosyltransferase